MNCKGAKAKGVQKTMSFAKSVPKIPSQITSMLAGRQMGMGDSAYLKFRATLQEVTTKIECCNLEECSGAPAKTKITLCPSGVEQVTSIEITHDGSHLLFGTSANGLYLVDLWRLRKLDPELVIDSKIEKVTMEYFKIISKYDTTGSINEVTKVLGPRSVDRPDCMSYRQGIHCLELSPSGLKIMTCGQKSNQLKIVSIDESRNVRNKRKFDNCDVFDKDEAWTSMGVLTRVASNYGVGRITGGTWINETCTASVDSAGTLKVCRIQDDKFRARVPAEHQIFFPNHALPVEGNQAYPVGERLSSMVNIDKITFRDEYIATTWSGEIYVLKADDKLGITVRGARREGIPRGEFHFSDQRKERLILSQAIDVGTGMVVVGTLSGLTFLDTRIPNQLNHAKLYDARKPREMRQREMDQGAPVSMHVQNHVVTAGLYNGVVAFFDMRNQSWVRDDDSVDKLSRLTWNMGVQEAHKMKNRNNPNNYPLVTLRKHRGILAVGGGPVYGRTAMERTLEGVITVWE